jgi:hypothetical protein
MKSIGMRLAMIGALLVSAAGYAAPRTKIKGDVFVALRTEFFTAINALNYKAAFSALDTLRGYSGTDAVVKQWDKYLDGLRATLSGRAPMKASMSTTATPEVSVAPIYGVAPQKQQAGGVQYERKSQEAPAGRR